MKDPFCKWCIVGIFLALGLASLLHLAIFSRLVIHTTFHALIGMTVFFVFLGVFMVLFEKMGLTKK